MTSQSEVFCPNPLWMPTATQLPPCTWCSVGSGLPLTTHPRDATRSKCLRSAAERAIPHHALPHLASPCHAEPNRGRPCHMRPSYRRGPDPPAADLEEPLVQPLDVVVAHNLQRVANRTRALRPVIDQAVEPRAVG